MLGPDRRSMASGFHRFAEVSIGIAVALILTVVARERDSSIARKVNSSSPTALPKHHYFRADAAK